MMPTSAHTKAVHRPRLSCESVLFAVVLVAFGSTNHLPYGSAPSPKGPLTRQAVTAVLCWAPDTAMRTAEVMNAAAHRRALRSQYTLKVLVFSCVVTHRRA